MRLCDFPQGIFVMALSTAALPALSTLAAKGAHDEFAKTWAHGMNLAMFVAIPASVGLLALSEPIVVTVFQRGAFDATAAHETARALFWQGGAIWTVAAVRQTVPALYALGDTKTPVIISAIDLTAFIALALGLRGSMGHAGISVAVAGSSVVQMALLLAALKRRLGAVRLGDVAKAAARTLAVSVAAAAGGATMAWSLRMFASDNVLGRLVPGLVGMGMFAILFFGIMGILHPPEYVEITGALGRRLGRGRATKGAAP